MILRGITWEHPRGFGSVHGASPFYKSIAPDISIEWEFRSLQAFADRSIEELSQDFDLLIIDHPHIPMAAEGEIFAPFTDPKFEEPLNTLKVQSVGKSFESYMYNEKVWALPIDAAAQVSASRISELVKHPTNWDQVRDLAKENRVAWPLKPIDAFSSFITIATNLGHPPMKEKGIFLQRESVLAVLDFMHDIIQFIPKNNFEMNPIEVAELLSSDSQWIYSPLLFGYTNYSRAGFRKYLLRYRDIPVGPGGISGSLLGGAGIAVSSKSNSIVQAQKFSLWLASSEIQKTFYFDAGGQPGNSRAWEDQRLNSLTQDFFTGTRKTLEAAYLRPRDKRFISVQDEISINMTKCLTGEMSDLLFADSANEICARLMGANHGI